MLTAMRSKLGKWSIGLIIGAIVLAFVATSLLTDRTSRYAGGRGGGSVGSVNGDEISVQEFNRAYQQRIDFFKQMGGGQFSEEQLKAFRIKDSVFNELVRKKILIQAARDKGLFPSDSAVMDEIKKIPAFKKGEQFDPVTYRQVLEANHYTPAGFEKMIREDLAQRQWQDFFQSRAKVTDEELLAEYKIQKDQRNIKYVVVSNETAKHAIKPSAQEITSFLADAKNVEAIKAEFSAKKDAQYKGKTFDDVKSELATERLVSGKSDLISKNIEEIAKGAQGLLKADKASDAKLNSYLKPYGAEVKSTGMVSRENPFIPGAGEAKDMMAAAFKGELSKPKTFKTALATLVAVVTESKSPDMAAFDKEKDSIRTQLTAQMRNEMLEGLVAELTKKASIKKSSLLGEE